MSWLEVVLALLFALFFVGTCLRIAGMLERKKEGGDVERPRLVFFFVGCLMLVCLIPLHLFELLGQVVWIADLAVVAANFTGYALTYDRSRSHTAGGAAQEKPAGATVRAYQLYFRGKPYALITKEGIDLLLAHKLLKRQHTVELVEDFQTQAQRAGVDIRLLRNKADGKTMLMRVAGPAPRGNAPT